MQSVYAFFGVGPDTFWIGIAFGILFIIPLLCFGMVPIQYEDDDNNEHSDLLTVYLMRKLSGFIFSKKMLIACSALFIAYQVNATLSAYRAACNAKVAAFEKIGK